MGRKKSRPAGEAEKQIIIAMASHYSIAVNRLLASMFVRPEPGEGGPVKVIMSKTAGCPKSQNVAKTQVMKRNTSVERLIDMMNRSLLM